MKLSELFNKPFKLKGGSILNLKGFSKRVVDKDIDDGAIEGIGFIPKNEVLIAKGSSHGSSILYTINKNNVLAFCINGVFYGLDKVIDESGNLTIRIINTPEFGIYISILDSSIEIHSAGRSSYVYDKDYILNGLLVIKE